MQYYIYILATNDNKVIYTGVTNDLRRRVYEHKNSLDKTSFTSRYHVKKLVYFECTNNAEAAIAREKQIKSWNRNRKNKLIASKNPEWTELYANILE
ncbi:MAG: GIY-YIG nuclease family protein [Oscillospiraceae bacterium]|nr:GIY-YIG nuclease family protein [Oscillospiraceae bacterium]